MEFPERMSAKVTAVIAAQMEDYTDEKLAEINYGIAIFIANSYKLLIIFIMAILLDVFKDFLVAFVSFGLLRSFASGYHAKHEWTCLPSSILLFFGIIYLGNSISLSISIISLAFALCFIAMLKYAPAGTEERPIVSRKLRKKLKIMSCITLLLSYAVSLYNVGNPFSSIIVFSILAESAMILPITYNLAGSIYGSEVKQNKKMEV